MFTGENLTIPMWPERGLMVVAKCPVCHSGQRTTIHADLVDTLFHSCADSWEMKQCITCGCGYLDPSPTPETLGLAYANYYTHYAPGAGADRVAVESVRGRLVRRWANGYRNWKYGTSYKNASRFGAFAVAAFPPAARLFDADSRHLPRPVAGNNRLLDVGCGNGKFLKFAEEAGWDAEGIDLDPAAIEFCQESGLRVSHGTVESIASSVKQFDLITASHVIEHVFDPISFLKACHSLLKPGGRIWLETPNIEACGHVRFGLDWRGLEPPRHLVLFSFDAVEQALMRSGFSRIRHHNRGLTPFFVYPRSSSKSSEAASTLNRWALMWASLVDTAREYFNPRVREFHTVSAEANPVADSRD